MLPVSPCSQSNDWAKLGFNSGPGTSLLEVDQILFFLVLV